MPQRTRIKICGICRAEDARVAAEAGADAIGMIFHPPSQRNVDVETARSIVAVLPPFVMSVGVFVNASMDRILDTAAKLGLGAVQLHGDEGPERVVELSRHGFRVVKALRVDVELRRRAELWREGRTENLAGIVLETAAALPGGTGIANDFQAIRQLMDGEVFADLPPVIVAGGLTPENVASVVALLRPYAVDVSSGVESKPREKSREKIEAFIAAARG